MIEVGNIDKNRKLAIFLTPTRFDLSKPFIADEMSVSESQYVLEPDEST